MIRWSRWLLCIILSSMALVFADAGAFAACRKVGDGPKIQIGDVALRSLASIGISRPLVFAALKDVSIPETEGCWAGATGNFDGQLISVGTLQWNYGQNSLQPSLRRFRSSFHSSDEFSDTIDNLMPLYGRKLIFTAGCLRQPVTDDCRQAILSLQDEKGRLKADFRDELDALFESDGMVQIQVDRFVGLLQSVRDDLKRLFPGDDAVGPNTIRRVKWAIDTKVQQGGFPGDLDVKRVREAWKKAAGDAEQRREKLLSLVDWYTALSRTIDQGGTIYDWKWNDTEWRKLIKAGIPEDQSDLLNLTFLRSRTAVQMSGHWQALTFERRATIVLGKGSIAGRRFGGQ